ncbi:hypothetical protein [Prevotella koreensis]
MSDGQSTMNVLSSLCSALPGDAFRGSGERTHNPHRSSLNPHRSPPPLNILMNINDKKSEIIGA